MTILLYVRRKQWPLQSITVECTHQRVHCRDIENCEDDEGAYIDLINREITLDGDLSSDQKDRISYIARRCPVHRTLESGPRIKDVLKMVGEE